MLTMALRSRSRSLVALLAVAALLLGAGVSPARAVEPAGRGVGLDPNLLAALRLQAEAGEAYLTAAQALDRYLVVRGNSLVLEAPASVLAGVGKTGVAEVQATLAAADARLADGSINVSAAALLAGIRLLDGVTGRFWNWWGVSYCISNADLMNAWQWGYYSGAVIGILSVVDPILGVSATVAIAIFVAFDWGNGACLEQAWSGNVWMSAQ